MEELIRTLFLVTLQPFPRVVSSMLKYLLVFYGIKLDKAVFNRLEDNIRKRGAMDTLVSDSARADTSNRIKYIFHIPVISDWQGERAKTLQRTPMPLSRLR
jgi:hypothetical protein